MDKTNISKKINEIHQQFVNEKDGGRAFIAALAKEFNSYEVNYRKEVIDFFVQELQVNASGMRSLVLPVLEDMEANEAAPNIYETYLNFLKNDDEKWEKEIVETLIKLRYKEPKELYSSYIDKQLSKNKDDGYIFFLSVLYCRVDPNKALNLLSDYFCKHLAVPNETMVEFFKNRMGFLVGYFSKNPTDYISELIEQTAKKNRGVAIRLKEIMFYYFHSNLVRDDNKEIIERKIKALNDINI